MGDLEKELIYQRHSGEIAAKSGGVFDCNIALHVFTG